MGGEGVEMECLWWDGGESTSREMRVVRSTLHTISRPRDTTPSIGVFLHKYMYIIFL